MKWLCKISMTLLFAVVVTSAATALYYLDKVNEAYDDNTVNVFGEDPKYHFSLILYSGDDDEYWQSFKEGVFEAGKVHNAAIEYNPISGPDSIDKIVEYVNIANKSRVDGIIVNGRNSGEYSEAINNAAKSGIHIVVGVAESIDSDRLSYVGNNFYDYGVKAAKLISQATDRKSPVDLAVILADESRSDADKTLISQSDIMMSGITSVIEREKKINLLHTSYRSSDLLGAEDMTRNILTQYPEVDVIFCTNAKDTAAAARVIVERNLVGDVVIVGTGITDEIKYYIRKGIIFGVLDRNGYKAGYKAVEILCGSVGDSFQSSYINIDTDIYTKINIDQK
ncbi:MAG: sugar ABC transporter substrate-binding protein [Clostridiaceae bacterium]|jgi:ribose transport system substrate-binding protein|nr:substrate-binding domain-containing protein [Bacillota bacterium]NLP06592.1 sugar ABC transporter substrate-binding protein [Clostridiaceae bacterium]HOA54723.1 substrate-binding domain-containing protein [Clostridiales bacterium]HPZ04742.1 substrate-binding domain-containing protein [Clostridiales bacterium]HQD30848.1 substrate-binding domain-containing protein [Clostridiales bacterium]